MARHNNIGKWGEEMACEYLLTHGYTIVESDKQIGHAEVDIIAIRESSIHFIEVKTRSDAGTDPFEAITPAKIRRICRFADSYLRNWELPYRPQFDIIGIIGSPDTGVQKFDYIPDAFFPPLTR